MTLPYTNTEQSAVANLAIAAGAPVLASRISGLAALFAELDAIEDLAPVPLAATLEQTLAGSRAATAVRPGVRRAPRERLAAAPSRSGRVRGGFACLICSSLWPSAHSTARKNSGAR